MEVLLKTSSPDLKGIIRDMFNNYEVAEGDYQQKCWLFFMYFHESVDDNYLEYFIERFFQDSHLSVSERFEITLIVIDKLLRRKKQEKPVPNEGRVSQSLINKCLEVFVKELVDMINEDKSFYLLLFVCRLFQDQELVVEDLFKFLVDSRVVKKLQQIMALPKYGKLVFMIFNLLHLFLQNSFRLRP